MKIIDEKPHPDVTKRKICPHCGITLEYVPNDVKTRSGTDPHSGGWTVSFIHCPKCKREITVGRVD